MRSVAPSFPSTGATTIAGPTGERQPSKDELDAARFQGKHVASIATKLAA